MWQALLAALKSFGEWLVPIAMKHILKIIKDYVSSLIAKVTESIARRKREREAQEIIKEIEAVDQKIDEAKTPEEINELRNEKIALEESLINGKS